MLQSNKSSLIQKWVTKGNLTYKNKLGILSNLFKITQYFKQILSNLNNLKSKILILNQIQDPIKHDIRSDFKSDVSDLKY